MRWISRPILLCLAAVAGAGISCRKAGPPIPMPDWQYEIMWKPDFWLQQPGVALLRDYVRIDTTNPPGHERRGAEFLKAYLECEGIPSELVCSEADRCNLYSRLPGKDHERAVLLLNHIDVVGVYQPAWTKPAFGGVIENGYLYGRGAYDMKSTAIAQLLAFVDLWHSGRRPARDVIYLAECGEETFGTEGVSWIFAHRPELLSGVNFVLGEGGYDELIAGELRFWGLEVGQAGFGFFWLSSDSREALVVPTPYRGLKLDVAPDDAVRRYFRDIAEFRPPYFANAFRHPELLRHETVSRWIPYQYLSLVTGGVCVVEPYEARFTPYFDFGRKWNAAVLLSLPIGIDPEPYVQGLLAEQRGRGIQAGGAYSGPVGATSPYPTPDTESVRKVIEVIHPGLPFIPTVNTFMSTTSEEFRAKGIPAYGFSPIRIGPGDASRRHGNDERVFLPFYCRGLTLMREVLFELAFQ